MKRLLPRALGDDLQGSVDPNSPVYWGAEASIAEFSLPQNCDSLAKYVQGPDVLKARLSQIAIVADEAACRSMASQLRQGQRVVSREGDLYRWDGFTMKAGAVTASQLRLERRNRLIALAQEIKDQTEKNA